jgi:hypothetical protein
MTGMLLLRCQYAFKTAAGMALGGQVVEVFAMLRSVLEYAGYCLTIYETPDLESVFIGRHTGTGAMKAQKEATKISSIRTAIARHDVKLAKSFDELYRRPPQSAWFLQRDGLGRTWGSDRDDDTRD